MMSYRMMLLIGVLAKSGNKGVGVPDLQKRLGIRRIVTVYEMLQTLQQAGMVEKEVQMDKRVDGRPPNNFVMTEKGLRYAETYKLTALADTPTFVTMEKFK